MQNLKAMPNKVPSAMVAAQLRGRASPSSLHGLWECPAHTTTRIERIRKVMAARLTRAAPRFQKTRAAAVLLVAPMFFAACGKDSITKPGTYTLTGQVRLVGALRNDAGDSIDVQRVENADSVRVYLYQGSTLKDSTRTSSGGYRFGGLSGGPYSVATALWGGNGDPPSVASRAAGVGADTPVLPSSPPMNGVPN